MPVINPGEMEDGSPSAIYTPPALQLSELVSGSGSSSQWDEPRTPPAYIIHQINGTSTSTRVREPSRPQSPRRHRHTLPSPALTSPSPQKEPGADGYLSRLLRLAQHAPTRAQHTSSAMTDFLASFGLGAQSPAVSSNPQCDSVEELQHQLRGILDAKATPTHAEHVAITIELRATVRFQLAVSEPENGVLENLNNLDPSLGGAQCSGMNDDQNGSQLPRVVFANDTLMNQPQDDPALQRSVAKHIISTISSTDGSTWIVREVSRGTQGWTFTYVCKDSYQQWNRQNAKNRTKTVVGEFSQREPDPILHSKLERLSRIYLQLLIMLQHDLRSTAEDPSPLPLTAAAALLR